MKKGFTLIELLAVIVILAIILVIAVPQINNIIQKSKINTYTSSEKMIINASENYMIKNIENMPTNIGDTFTITLDDLQTGGYIKEIKSPINSNTCNGYVLVVKTVGEDYEYIPHLNCVEDIGTKSDDKLLAHYTCNNNVFDYSSNDNDGTKVGNVTYVDDPIMGNVCSFGAYPSYIDLPIGLNFDMANPYSFSMWVKSSSISGQPIFFAVSTGTNQRLYMSIYYGKWDIGIAGTGWGSSFSVTPATTNWTNLVLVMNGSTAKLYVNGKFSMQKSFIPYSLASNFRIGCHYSTDSVYQFNGYMDDIRIYNRLLSEEEIKINYDAVSIK